MTFVTSDFLAELKRMQQELQESVAAQSSDNDNFKITEATDNNIFCTNTSTVYNK